PRLRRGRIRHQPCAETTCGAAGEAVCETPPKQVNAARSAGCCIPKAKAGLPNGLAPPANSPFTHRVRHPAANNRKVPMREIRLQDLKVKAPTELLTLAEELEVENASTLRKQVLLFAILKQMAPREVDIIGGGVVEVLQDGFGFLRSPDANYLAGPDDIYISPSQIRRFSLRTGDTIEGQIRSPKDAERYFALL